MGMAGDRRTAVAGGCCKVDREMPRSRVGRGYGTEVGPIRANRLTESRSRGIRSADPFPRVPFQRRVPFQQGAGTRQEFHRLNVGDEGEAVRGQRLTSPPWMVRVQRLPDWDRQDARQLRNPHC